MDNDTNLRNSCVPVWPRSGSYSFAAAACLSLFNSIFIALTFGNTGSDINRRHAKSHKVVSQQQ